MDHKKAYKLLTATIAAYNSFVAKAPKDTDNDDYLFKVANAAKDFVVAYKKYLDGKKEPVEIS